MPEVIINGPEGRIEGRYHQNSDPKAPVALVLHPHPLHGGTMNNKIVYNLYKTFANNGFTVLRINFRGVGKSEGKFFNGIGELQDANTALNWLHAQNMDASTFWLGGFSFGSWIGLQLVMRRPDLEGYILVAPPVTKYDFNFIVPCPASGLIIQGDEDVISKEVDTAKIVTKLDSREEEGFPAAVLIRGILTKDQCFDGPGKLCRYFGINKDYNKVDITSDINFYLSDNNINYKFKTTSRIGISKGKDKLWRFVADL